MNAYLKKTLIYCELAGGLLGVRAKKVAAGNF
jgi:hypothetical protein